MPPVHRLLLYAWLTIAGVQPALVLAQASAAAPAASAPAPLNSALPLRRDEPRQPETSSWLAGTALLLVALTGGVVAVRRGRWPWLAARKTPEAGRWIERLSSQPLTGQASLHAIRWHGEELLVACSAQQVTVLARRPAGQEGGQP